MIGCELETANINGTPDFNNISTEYTSNSKLKSIVLHYYINQFVASVFIRYTKISIFLQLCFTN